MIQVRSSRPPSSSRFVPAIALVAITSCLVVAAPVARGAEIHVPADWPTIGAAIGAASAGDTVLVAPGVWRESIDFHGKAITVASEQGAAVTVVDGSGFPEVVRFATNETASSRLVGLTLTRSAFTEFEKVIRCSAASPVIADCVIADCTYVQPWCPFLDRGILIRVDGGSPRFERCAIRDNTFTLPCLETAIVGFVYGSTSGDATFEDCEITANVVTTSTGSAYLMYSEGTLRLIGCAIEDGLRGGVFATGAAGSQLVVSGCRIRGCAARAAITLAGAVTFTIEETELTGNAREGLFLGSGSSGVVRKCTFADNSPAPGGFDVTFDTFPLSPWTGTLLVEDSIVWGKGFAPGMGAPKTVVRYSDVTGGFAGPGNLAADPKFVAAGSAPVPDYSLAPGSPCIDAGDPAGPLDDDGTRADMGAYAYAPWHAVSAGDGGTLAGMGSLHPNTEFTIALAAAAPRRPFLVVAGAHVAALPLPAVIGSILVPSPDVIVSGFATDVAGAASIASRWPSGTPSGVTLAVQVFVELADGHVVASDGLVGVSP